MKNDLLKTFSKLSLALFKEPLGQHGFKRELKKTEDYFCQIIYGNGERYVKISANIHPRDYPPHFNIILGEGGRDFFESDWNSIALWRLKNHILQAKSGREYHLENTEKISELLEHARDELLKFGLGFLTGDIELFRKVRSEQNRDRAPYQIYSPDKDGKYKATEEPLSAIMKYKYS